MSEDAGCSTEADDQGVGARRCTGDHRGPPARSEAGAGVGWGNSEAWAAPGEAEWRNEARGSEASCRDREI